jgi:hypothetical protein
MSGMGRRRHGVPDRNGAMGPHLLDLRLLGGEDMLGEAPELGIPAGVEIDRAMSAADWW